MSAVPTNVERDEKAALIACQNDRFRAALPYGPRHALPGRYHFSHGVMDNGPEFVVLALFAVAAFADFTPDNDPYGDHTFGALEVCGVRLFWKIDLYDENYEFGSDDPSDPQKTRRLLTIFLPSEY